jgi:tRNA G18 (ribose-2'-O)-methylase SpoU
MKPIETTFRHKPRGWFGVGACFLNYDQNIGSLFRTAQFMGASYIYTIGNEYERQSSDTGKSWKDIPLMHYKLCNDFYISKPKSAQIVSVEITENSTNLVDFVHPEQAIYLLGNETSGLPTNIINASDHVIHIPSTHCLNVAVAGSIVIYDRIAKLSRNEY